MNKIALYLISLCLLTFLTGFTSCYALFNLPSQVEYPFSYLFAKTTNAPSKTLSLNNIKLYNDRVVIFIDNPLIGRYAPTGSMLPVLNENTIGIKIIPKNEEEIKVGDIITFKNSKGELIIHRVIEKGKDDRGTYFITKGDNTTIPDGKIRFKQIKFKTIILVY